MLWTKIYSSGKQSLVLSGAQKQKLRSQAMTMQPHVRVGKNGIDESLIKAVNEALEKHKLIKVRFEQFKDQRKLLAEEIAMKCDCHLIQILGHVAVFYKA